MSIKRIAQITGFSPSTVSRVLNKPNYKCSSEEIREIILKVAREEGYVPNEAARSLKLGKNVNKNMYNINIIVTKSDSAKHDPFFVELQHAVEIEIHKNTCLLSKVWERPIFSNEEKCRFLDTDKLLDEIFGQDEEQKCDGIIIVGICSTKILKALNQRCRNIVAINRHSTNYIIDEVTCSGERIASIAVNHLIDLGHRKIGYVGGIHNKSRFNGYTQTLFEHKININPNYIYETELSEEHGYLLMEKIIQNDDVPTAFYCSNDIVAVGMLKYLKKYKSKNYFPSLISCDDIDAAQYTQPMLTTVKIPKDEMATLALNILLDRINGNHKSVVKISIDGKLIVRDSCTTVDNSMTCEYFI